MTPFEQHLALLRTRFVRRARDDADRIRAALDAGDFGELRSVCHGLSGSAGMFGFAETGVLAGAVEEAVDRGAAAPELRQLSAALLDGIERLVQER